MTLDKFVNAVAKYLKDECDYTNGKAIELVDLYMEIIEEEYNNFVNDEEGDADWSIAVESAALLVSEEDSNGTETDDFEEL